MSGKFFPLAWCNGKKPSASVQRSLPETLLAVQARTCKKAPCLGEKLVTAVLRLPQGHLGVEWGEVETLFFNDCEFVS